MMAAAGDWITTTGSGTFDATAATVHAKGTFVHYDTVMCKGTWQADGAHQIRRLRGHVFGVADRLADRVVAVDGAAQVRDLVGSGRGRCWPADQYQGTISAATTDGRSVRSAAAKPLQLGDDERVARVGTLRVLRASPRLARFVPVNHGRRRSGLV
jgi:hypothetical protein